VTIKTGPPITAAQAAQLVKDGCSSLPGVAAAVTSAAATYTHDPYSSFLALYHGPWYRTVGMIGAGTDPVFAHIVADAKTFDLAALGAVRREVIPSLR
jgi:hypothetical protein